VVGIVDERENEYAVYPPEKEEELRKLQGHLIEFTVVFLEKPQAYGSLFLKGGTVTPVTWEIKPQITQIYADYADFVILSVI